MKSPFLKFVSVILIILLINNLNSISTKIPCPLEWISAHHGQVPEGSLPCNNNANEFICRVFMNQQWLPCVLKADTGFAYTVNGSSVTKLRFYETLVPASFCLWEWEQLRGGTVSRTSVEVSPSKTLFIGSVQLFSRNVCGGIDIEQQGILLPHQNGSVGFSRDYYALSIFYPPLKATLSDFKFDTGTLHERSLLRMLVEMSKLEHSMHPLKPTRSILEYKFSHKKAFFEDFYIFEQHYDWFGIDEIHVFLNLWFEGVSVQLKKKCEGGCNGGLALTRYKVINVRGKVSSTSGLNPADPFIGLDICSFVDTLEEEVFDITAKITFSAEKMNRIELEKYLSILLRLTTPSLSDDNDKVVLDFSGVLRGSFVLNSGWRLQEGNLTYLCNISS